jgi:hypothetical protein
MQDAGSVADLWLVASKRGSRSPRLSRPDRCAVCDLALAVGELALWHPGPRLVTCSGCSLDQPKVIEGPPGGSAQREYDRRHRQREEHARQKLGGLGVAVARMIDEPRAPRPGSKEPTARPASARDSPSCLTTTA